MRKKTPIGERKKSPEPQIDSDPSGEELFLRAMADVVPIQRKTRRVLPAPVPRSAKLSRVAELSDPPSPPEAEDGSRSWTRTRHGRQRLVKRLQRGEFPVEEDLDLHGLTQAQARKELEIFLRESSERGLTCVRIIHGKGWNSPNRLSVLRKRVPEWLAQGANSKLVAAFASARLCDGGTGAVYVLLRRDETGGVQGSD